MAAVTHTFSDVGRPKIDKPKDAVITTRTHPELKSAIETYARTEHRTIAQMTELLLREAVIARRKRDRESAVDIERLP